MTRFLSFALTLAIFSLAGCGGESSSPAAATTPPPPPVTQAPKATLSWDAPTTKRDGTPLTDLAGFTLYHGLSADELNTTIVIDNPDARSYTVEDLDGGLHYFTLTAFDQQGRESAKPTPVSKDVR